MKARRAVAARPYGSADIIAAHGRHFLVIDDHGERHAAVPRGRQLEAVVGDRVRIATASADQMVIEQIEPRRNLIRRSDRYRSKAIAANVDRVLAVISGEPRYDEALLLRVLLSAAAEGIATGLVATKQDLDAAAEAIEPRLAVHEREGMPVWRVTASPDGDHTGLDALRSALTGRRTALLGQSGMGKSTLVNALVPTAGQQTASISRALNSGRHTTTDTRAFELPGGGTLIDSPGFQTFEIEHLSHWQIGHAMPEFTALLGRCRFNDCQHLDEPGCAIRPAAESGRIDALRYRLYRELIESRNAGAVFS